MSMPSGAVKPLPAVESTGAWFDAARFGLFLHWGLYSILSDKQGGEWVLFKQRLHREEYNRLADQFTASRFDPDAWVAQAKRAGMRYVVLTTRHHDGFCLFRTATTRFNAVATAAGRDLVAEFVAACRRGGVRIGLYYSIMSWQHDAIFSGPGADPAGWAAMVEETHAQLRELMTNYGRIDMLWYDGAVVPGIQDNGMQARFWRSRELNAMVRSLQPGILINDRSGLDEDFSTPEQHLTAPPAGRRWEACMTLNRSWGYSIHDRDFKTPAEVVRCLVHCARHGGNLLLDIGPRADGTVQEEFAERLDAVGRWLAGNGAAIYGSRRCAYTDADHAAGATTWDGERIYVHLADPRPGVLRLDGAGRATAATLLGPRSSLPLGPAAGGAGEVVLPAGVAGPAVIALALTGRPPVPASLLGGGGSLRLQAGNAPVLGEDPDRLAPPAAPVVSDEMLRGMLRGGGRLRGIPSGQRCPGWQGFTVFAPQRLELGFSVPAPGAYDLELGLIASLPGRLAISLDGRRLPGSRSLVSAGCPGTCTLEGEVLARGRHRLVVEGPADLGIYAMRLTPRWRPLGMESWWSIGPFPTGFAPRQPVSEVRVAMRTAWPPESGFDPAVACRGVGGAAVRWRHDRRRLGEHSAQGVDFPYRCGTGTSGICYARTVITSPDERVASVLLGCDWWADLWVGGRRVRGTRPAEAVAEDGAQFSGWKPQPATVRLRRGANPVLVKCHPGSCANWFTFRISDPGDLAISPGS